MKRILRWKLLVDQAEKAIYAIAQRRLSGEFFWIRDLLKDAYDRIDRMYHRKRFHTGVPSGFEDLDRLTTGFQPADLIIVAARPSIGKTSLCLNIAENAGLKEKVPVAIFSLEMSKEQLVQRMISSLARVDAQDTSERVFWTKKKTSRKYPVLWRHRRRSTDFCR